MLKLMASEGSHLRCAKRSSASVKTAIETEAALHKAGVENMRVRHRAASAVNACDPQLAVQLRRDLKNCIDQEPRALSCGDVPLVSINALGRCVRVFGQWTCICAFCGCMMHVRHGGHCAGEPCCGRCDVKMLLGAEAASELPLGSRRSTSQVACRFCGKPQPTQGASKWKVVHAPADDGGRNANVPPPLRQCVYCPLHWRPWLPLAHRIMPTNVIFSHISMKAKPVFGADLGKRCFEAVEGIAQSSATEKRRKRSGRRRSVAGKGSK